MRIVDCRIHRRDCFQACLWLLLAGSSQTLMAQDAMLEFEQSVVEAIETAERSVVSLTRIQPDEAAGERPQFEARRSPLDDPDNPESPEFVPYHFGSGVLIAAAHDADQRLVLTNYHVVLADWNRSSQKLPTFFVRAGNSFAGYARIRAADPRSDLAVLEFLQPLTPAELAQLPPIQFTARTAFRKGQFVIAIGNPYALARDGSPSAGLGMIANTGRSPGLRRDRSVLGTRREQTIYELGGLLQLDMRLYLGMSGGAVVDRRGRLVGLSTAQAALDGYEKSAGFAIPMDSLTRRVINELSRGWEVNYGLLGVQTSHVAGPVLEVMRSRFGRNRLAEIDSVIPNSPAAAAGLQRGDVLLSIAGVDVHSPRDVTREIGRSRPGDPVELRIWRPAGAGTELKLPVQVGKWPVDDEQAIVSGSVRYKRYWGIGVDFATARRRYLSGLEYVAGVLVLEVAPGSPADLAKIRPGDFLSHVNGQPVRTPSEFVQQADAASGQVTLQLVDHRGPVRSVVLTGSSSTESPPK